MLKLITFIFYTKKEKVETRLRTHSSQHAVRNIIMREDIALKCYNQQRLENYTPSQIIHRAPSNELLLPPVAFSKFVVWAQH